MSGERVPVHGFDETWLRLFHGMEEGFRQARLAGDAARDLESAFLAADTVALQAHAARLVAATKAVAGTIGDMQSLRSEIENRKRDGGKA